MKKLCISNDLTLPLDWATGTAGIFATKGMGKTHLAQVIAEELLELGQVVVVIDPTDASWGLRSSADGKRDGYPIVVIGGDHGDLPLDPNGGAQLAESIVRERFSAIVCTDGLDDYAQVHYVRQFLEVIYRLNREPIHVIVDEADIFAPQVNDDQEQVKSRRVMAHIVRRGRRKGIGSTIITQRPAELHATVRSMVETLFVLGMGHNLDIEAIEKWMRLRKLKSGANAVAFELREEMIESLTSLPIGEAWCWAPRHKIHRRFRAREKRTFDSGATPKIGQKARTAKRLAPVDIARLGEAIAATVQRQKENDPKHLKAEVARLKKANDELAAGVERAIQTQFGKASKAVKVPRVVKQPILKDAQIKRIEKAIDKGQKLAQRLVTIGDTTTSFYKKAAELAAAGSLKIEMELGKLRDVLTSVKAGPITPAEVKEALAHGAEERRLAERPASGPGRMPPNRVVKGPQLPLPAVAIKALHRNEAEGTSTIRGGLRRILIALAQCPNGLTNRQIGIRAVLSSRSGTFATYISRARSEGWVEDTGDVRRITSLGVEALGHYDPLPTGEDLANYWLRELGASGAARILRVVIDAYPEEIDPLTIGERAKLSSKSGTYATYVSKLRGLELVAGRGPLRASEDLFS